MSDDSDVNPGRTRRKRNALVGDNSDSSIETISRRRRRRKHKNYVRESDTESDSSVEILRKKKRLHRVASDSDGSSSGGSMIIKATKRNVIIPESDASSSGSEVIRTRKTISALVTDSESDNANDSDSEYDSDWITEPEPENNCKTTSNTKPDAHIEDNGAASDSSDGQTEKCPICLLPFKTQEVASPESCDHCFCVDCIIEWSKNVNTCPVDRQPFNLVLVRKNYNGKVVKQIPIDLPQQQNEVDEIVEDPTFCEICGSCDREDRMLLCDGCDLGYHLECLTPPLADIPIGAWFCADCGPELRVDDPMIDIYEVHLLLEDAETLGWPTGPRRRNTAAPRLVPRTRQSERVRARIITHRNQRRDDRRHEHNETLQSHEAAQNLDQPGPSTSSPSSSRNRSSALTSVKQNKKRRYKKRKKRKSNIKITYEIDEATGQKIAIETKIKRRYKRKQRRKTRSQRNKARCVARAKTVKKRLAVQLGMCPPKVNQTLPDMRVQHNSSSIGLQRSQAGIPTLHLFGQRHELDYFSRSESECEEEGDGVNVVIRRRPQLSDASILRRAVRRKSVIVPQVTSTSNILDSILDSQSKFHSKNTVLSLNKDGTVIVDKKGNRDLENNLNIANRNVNVNRNRINLNNYNNAHTRQTPMYGNSNGTNENIPISSNTTDFVRRNSSENQTVSTSSTEAVRSNRLNNDTNSDPNYSTQNVCSSYDSEVENKKGKDKDKSRSNTPATHSDSEFDIYSDIETVSTSRAEESDIRAPPSPPRLGTPNTPTDEDANNSDVDLVIDTEKVESEKFDDSKEQVSSTVDSTGSTVTQKIINSHAPHSTSDVQHEIVQSSGQSDNRSGIKRIIKDYDDDDDNDEDSEDGCPNFSIYSTESIKLAKNTDLQLLNDNSLSGLPVQSVNTSNEVKDKYESYNNEPESLVGTSIYSDASFMINSFHNETTSVRPESSENALSSISDNEKQNDEAEAAEMASKAALKSGSKSKFQLKVKSDKPLGLYSDSEDESLIKINHDKPFGIGDLRNMTEDISEEERSYTPCLDEKAPVYKQGLEGLETELISDEDRNDFDESHELKTISEGDALEINAKESELDFTKPEDYEEGEIVDKLKAKMAEEDSKKLNSKEKENTKESDPKTDDRNKENEADNTIIKEASSFKKLSKNNKERNYRDKDKGDKEKERSKSREKRDKSDKEKEKKKKEKRKEIERYNVRSMIAEKPRRVTKDKFGRELRGRRSDSKSSLSLTPPRRSLSREPRRSRSRSKKRRARSRPRRSATRSRSPERKRSRSPRAKKRRSLSRDKNKPRRKSRDRSKNKLPKENPTRQKSRSVSPRRRREFGNRRHSRGWSRSLTRSISPEQRLTPSWTPPRLMETQTVRPRNLTVILNNDLNKKKKEKKKKEKRAKELEKSKRRKKDRTPPPSKEVFASGNNILVSVSFNKDNNERDVSKRKRDCVDDISTKRTRKEKEKRKKDDRRKKRNQAVSGLKPVAIIDLERSPFREIIPAAEDVIVLTDSENGESNDLLALQTAVCDSSQQVVSPERSVNTNYLTGPKTPPEPQVKFSLTAKQPQLRAISNPLHEPDDLEGDIDPQEELEQRLNESLHKGPNTPPEPPNSPPSSPDVYDPFDPTKSRSPTPEPIPQTVQSSTSQNDNTRDESLMDSRNDDDLSTLTDTKSHTPPVVTDIQPADSQSNVKATTPEKSPEHQISVIINQVVQSQASIFPTVASKPLPTFSTASSMITSTPLANLSTPRINIINSTILTPATVASAVPQRIVLPNTIKSSPVKVSPNKLPIKSTPIKPMPVKALINKSSLAKRKRNQENADVTLDFDSPYSPGSSDYEDLFEPPPDAGIKKPPLQQPQQQSQKNTKSPAKMQSAFDTLFGSSPVNPNFKKNSNKNEKPKHKKNVKGSKLVGVKIDEDTLKILDELPNSAVEMQVKDKYLKKLNRQERVVDEVKLVLKPHYNKKHINKEEYKDILRRAVPKICHNKSGEINPKKIQNLIEAYVKKIRHSKKVTSSSSSMNPQKA